MKRNKIVLSRRLKLVLVSIVLVSILVGTILALQSPLTENPSSYQEAGQQSENHFSVIYRGYLPSYNDSFPDYYICINDLTSSTLEIRLYMEIKNQEPNAYYFKTVFYESPPTGWDINQMSTIGGYTVYAPVDGTIHYYILLERPKPSSIPEGRISETLNIAVQAYFDSNYTSFYDEDNFSVTFNLIDRTSPVWTVLCYDNFDDGTNQGWLGGGVTDQYYRSYPYSYKDPTYSSGYVVWKWFNISATFQEAYLIVPVRCGSSSVNFRIILNGTESFREDWRPWADNYPEWYQLTVPIWTGYTEVQIWEGTSPGFQIDDIYLIAK